MKARKIEKKLNLNKETVVNVQPEEMSRVKGGGTVTQCASDCISICGISCIGC